MKHIVLVPASIFVGTAVQERYELSGFLSMSIASLQGIALRPLPCNYNFLQFVRALSRRCHRGRFSWFELRKE